MTVVQTDEQRAEVKRQAITGLKWQVFSIGARQALTFLTGIILARLLAPSDFGIISAAVVFVTWVSILGDAGIGAAVIQRTEIVLDDLKVAFWVSTSVGTFSATCLFLLSPLVGSFYGDGRVTAVLLCYVGSLLIGGLNVVPAALLRRSMKFRQVSIVEIVGTFTSGMSSIILVLNGVGVLSIPIGGMLGLLVSLSLYRMMHLWKVYALPKRNALARLGRFAAFASGARMLELIRIFIDNVSVGKFLGTSALGYYALGYNLIAVPEYRLVGLVTAIAFPALSRVQSDINLMRRAYLRMLRYASAIVFPVEIGLLLVSDRFIPLVYGDKWLPAVPVLQVLCLAGIGCSLAVLTDSPLMALGHAKWTFRLNLIWVCLIGLGLTIVFISGEDLLAVAWVVAMSAVSVAVLRNLVTARLCRASLREVIQAILPAGLATGAMAIMVMFAKGAFVWSVADWAQMVLVMSVGVIVYGLVAFGLIAELQSGIRLYLKSRAIARQQNQV